MTDGGFDGRFLDASSDQGVHVLHVDDDRAFGDLTATYLERLRDSFTVTSVVNAHAGLELLDEVDCIVSDYQMPEVDGLAFLDLVRERDGSLPFILFTGQGSEEIASDAISAGVTDYFQKGGGSEQYEVLANRIENVVARARSEHRLQVRERRYRELADASPVPMGIHLPEDGIVYANEAALTFFGADSIEDVLGRSALSFIHPDDRESVEPRTQSLFEGNSVTSGVKERFVSLDGEVRTGIVSAVPVTFEGRRAAYVVVNDISQYLDAQAQVETQEAIVQSIVDSLDDMVCIFDEDGSIVHWNDRVPEVTGYDSESLAEMDVPEFFHSDDREAVRAYVDQVCDEGEATAELDLLTADGERFPCEFHGVRVDGAEPWFRVGIARPLSDDTHRRELEEYKRLVETVGDPVYVLDENGFIETTNEAMAETIGIPLEDVVGKHASTFMADGDFERGTDLIMDILGDPDRAHSTYEYTVVRPGGEDVRVEDNIAPLTDTNGRLVGTMGVVRDISERKRRERELEQQNERLDEFASLLSHDLRNPLNVAQATVELLESDTSDLDEHLDILSESHERIAAIVDDALTLAKDGQSVTKPSTVRLDAIAKAAVATVETGDLSVTVTADGAVMADEPRLQRLLENLVRNAVDHGGDRVCIGRLDNGAADEVGFYVADDGPGIPEEDRETVFESGYTTVETGTGFGLAIVRQLADAHGWSVRVRDSEDDGARFEVRGVVPG